jgi:hypothetical protein
MNKLTTEVQGVFLGKTVKPATTWEGKTVPAKHIWNIGQATEQGQSILNVSCPVDSPAPPDYTLIRMQVVCTAYQGQLYVKSPTGAFDKVKL